MTINLTYDPHINEAKPNLENREYIQVIGMEQGRICQVTEAAVHKRTDQKVANLIEYIILSAGHIVGGVATVNIKHLSVMVITDDLGSSDVGSIPTGAVNTEMCNLFQS